MILICWQRFSLYKTHLVYSPACRNIHHQYALGCPPVFTRSSAKCLAQGWPQYSLYPILFPQNITATTLSKRLLVQSRNGCAVLGQSFANFWYRCWGRATLSGDGTLVSLVPSWWLPIELLHHHQSPWAWSAVPVMWASSPASTFPSTHTKLCLLGGQVVGVRKNKENKE